MRNRSVPCDTALPHRRYQDVASACAWLGRVFGFQEAFRYGNPLNGVQMSLGPAYVMLAGLPASGGTDGAAGSAIGQERQYVTIFVADVALHHQTAVREGAQIVEELHETVYGEMQYAAKDLQGYLWLFSQHVRDLSPEDWGGTSAPGQ